MSKGRTLKDLGSLPNLFTPAATQQPFATALAEHMAQPPKAQDIEDVILELMRNYRGWTVGDVQRCLKAHPDADLIPSVMNKFAHEGKFDTMQVTGRANSYTLKKQPLSLGTLSKPGKWVQREEVGVRQAPDPKGVIRVEEGLDIAIWKIMSDGKYRTKNDICAILSEYKFDRVQANRRVDSMINSRNYFDRRGAGAKGMSYVMKKHVPMPQLIDNLPGDNQSPLAKIEGNLSDQFMPSAAAIEVMDEVIKQDRTEQQENDVAQAAAAIPAVIDHSATMAEDDHLVTLIWKAMSDHKPYKSEEVHVLVQMFRPSQSLKSVQNKMSILGIDGWFEIGKQGKANVYTLKPGVANPNLKLNDLNETRMANLRKIAADSQAAPQQQELPVEQNQPAVTETKETEMSKATATSLVQVSQTAAPVAEVALIELALPIKGQMFSFVECRQIVEELQALGYGRTSGAVQNISMVSQKVTIKGLDFTKEELDTIVKKLVAEGFAKHLHSVR